MSISTELFGHFVCAQHGDGAAGGCFLPKGAHNEYRFKSWA